MNAIYDRQAEDEAAASGLKENKAEGVSPGEILREGRLAHDYSLDDLCAQTRLSIRTVKAMEENDFDTLSQPVFARGYYRQCGKVLDLDVERLMAAYSVWAGEPATPQVDYRSVGGGSIPEDVTPGGGFRFRGPVLLVLIAVVVIAAVVFLLPSGRIAGIFSGDGAGNQNNQTTTLSLDSPDNDAGNAGGDNAFASDDSGNAQSNAGTGTSSESAASDSVGAHTVDRVRTGQQAGGRNVSQTLGAGQDDRNTGDGNTGDQNTGAEDQPPAVPPNRLVLTFSARSWVRVTDANGNRMASGIFESGDKKEFNGTPPYKIKLGFAPGVKVSIGGQPVDVAARDISKSVANITVDAPPKNGASGQSVNQ